MDAKTRILVVDDEEDICEILQFNLGSEGYDVDVAYSAEEAIPMVQSNGYSLILLDVMMGGMSGFRMAEHLRKDLSIDVPIIFLTARDQENDMLTGFSLGADDYMSKPFSVKEVQARVKAVLRRSSDSGRSRSAGDHDVREEVRCGDIRIEMFSKSVYVGDTQVQLTKKEFEILLILVSSPSRIFSRAEILDKVWSDDVYVLERTVDVHITRLRKKLGDYGRHIVNRSNYGYMFDLL